MPSNYENNCGWVLDRIEPFLDDDLPTDELKRFQQHIDRCDTCARELAFATRIVGELRALPQHTAPASVLDGIDTAETPQASPSARITAWLDNVWTAARRPAMATMIVLLLATGVFVLTQHERSPKVSEAEIEAAAQETYLAFAYIGKYSRKTGYIVRDEVVDEVVRPMERIMIETKIIETKSTPERSDT